MSHEEAFEYCIDLMRRFKTPDHTMVLNKVSGKFPDFSEVVRLDDLRHIQGALESGADLPTIASACTEALRDGKFSRTAFDNRISGCGTDAVQDHAPATATSSAPQQKAAPSPQHRQIREYRILSDKSEEGLSSRVSTLLEDGWEPFGGVSFAALGMSPVGGNRFIQAIVKYAT